MCPPWLMAHTQVRRYGKEAFLNFYERNPVLVRF
jgi:hypothetical protein